MKSTSPQERHLLQLDPTAFLADRELIRVLNDHATPIVCKTDRILFHQDDPAVGLYILLEGKVTLSMDSHQVQPILSGEASDGSILGLPGLISDQPYSLTAIARAGARVSFLARAEFHELMHSNPVLGFKILQVLAAEVRSARKALY
ncbi:MAG: cyclic nucleotide-binding domain-containing protein [Terracidiphilus sp.]